MTTMVKILPEHPFFFLKKKTGHPTYITMQLHFLGEIMVAEDTSL